MNTQQNTPEIDVPALQARFAAITDMWQQAEHFVERQCEELTRDG